MRRQASTPGGAVREVLRANTLTDAQGGRHVGWRVWLSLASAHFREAKPLWAWSALVRPWDGGGEAQSGRSKAWVGETPFDRGVNAV